MDYLSTNKFQLSAGSRLSFKRACQAVLLFSLAVTVVTACQPVAVSSVSSEPIIVIPGMTASMNWDCIVYDRNCGDRDKWGWMVTAEGKYRRLIKALAKARGEQSVKVFHYDWRMPIQDNANLLEHEIDELLKSTGADKVILIGHSMGGLIGRAYVQEICTVDDCDVSRLFTIGSPHYGSSKVYPFWQAADFYRTNLAQRIAFAVLMKHYQKKTGEPEPVLVLRKKIPSMQDLLPTSNYVHHDSRGNIFPESSMSERNDYLRQLNSELENLFNRGTEITVIFRDDLITPTRFLVTAPDGKESPNWIDGKPIWGSSNNEWFLQMAGDKTVSASSAKLSDQAIQFEVQSGSHGELAVQSGTIEWILGSIPPGTPAQLIEQEIDSTEELPIVLVLHGQVQMTVTRVQDGASIGPRTGGPTIEAAEYISHKDDPFKVALIPDSSNRSYLIEIEGDIENYELLLLDTFTGDEGNIEFKELWIAPDQDLAAVVGGTAQLAIEYREEPLPRYEFVEAGDP